MNCDSCNAAMSKQAFLMLPDELWSTIADKKEFLCASCICNRLGGKCTIFVDSCRTWATVGTSNAGTIITTKTYRSRPSESN